VLEIVNLSKSFGDVRAVNQVNLSVPQGQMLGVIGRSGAGKSTLLRIINQLTTPNEGEIRFDGKPVSNLKGRALRQWRAQCAMIFQQFNLVNRLDVMTNVLIGQIYQQAFIPSLFKRYSKQERAQAIMALERLDLAAQALQRADTLSGGQQQRVAIAKALLQNPKIILADEPIASLDPNNATKVMDALRRINQEENIAVVCNLHHLDTAQQYCDRIIGMANGKIVFDGTPEQLTDEVIEMIYGDEATDAKWQASSPADSTTNPESQDDIQQPVAVNA
jgi:phosphonate transport system ATP-binding protein